MPIDLMTTVDLLTRVRSGDERATEVIFARCVRGLTRFAAGRLPREARGALDTFDVVQDTIMAVLKRVPTLDIQHEGALLAYLRVALKRKIIDVARKIKRRPMRVSLSEGHEDLAPSPFELAISEENARRYEAALRSLKPRDRAIVILKIEHQAEDADIAVRLGMPSGNAARVAVRRAVFRLAKIMMANPPPDV